jgi:hypothetical protein
MKSDIPLREIEDISDRDGSSNNSEIDDVYDEIGDEILDNIGDQIGDPLVNRLVLTPNQMDRIDRNIRARFRRLGLGKQLYHEEQGELVE